MVDIVEAGALERYLPVARALLEAEEGTTLDGICARALPDYLRAHLFFDDAAAERAGLSAMSEAERFYNWFYWYERFLHIQEEDGYEDSAFIDFSMERLEDIPEEVDWNVLQSLWELARGSAEDSRG
ncbi:MAG TPA: hypothetical protein VG939_19750 [Caulobacteraceae bacterium]|nr:hypothetical protein [Caulobacteraceae bacterium]